jgi:hypothetical protein
MVEQSDSHHSSQEGYVAGRGEGRREREREREREKE